MYSPGCASCDGVDSRLPANGAAARASAWQKAPRVRHRPNARPFEPHEQAIADLLAAEGKRVETVATRPGDDRRPHDARVDGRGAEFESLPSGATPDTVRDKVLSSVRRGGAWPDVYVDARGSGLTRAQAEEAVRLVSNDEVHSYFDNLRIFGDGFSITADRAGRDARIGAPEPTANEPSGWPWAMQSPQPSSYAVEPLRKVVRSVDARGKDVVFREQAGGAVQLESTVDEGVRIVRDGPNLGVAEPDPSVEPSARERSDASSFERRRDKVNAVVGASDQARHLAHGSDDWLSGFLHFLGGGG